MNKKYSIISIITILVFFLYQVPALSTGTKTDKLREMLKADISSCFQDIDSTNINGRIKLDIEIDPNGTVKKCAIFCSTFENLIIDSCLIDRIVKINFGNLTEGKHIDFHPTLNIMNGIVSNSDTDVSNDFHKLVGQNYKKKVFEITKIFGVKKFNEFLYNNKEFLKFIKPIYIDKTKRTKIHFYNQNGNIINSLIVDNNTQYATIFRNTNEVFLFTTNHPNYPSHYNVDVIDKNKEIKLNIEYGNSNYIPTGTGLYIVPGNEGEIGYYGPLIIYNKNNVVVTYDSIIYARELKVPKNNDFFYLACLFKGHIPKIVKFDSNGKIDWTRNVNNVYPSNLSISEDGKMVASHDNNFISVFNYHGKRIRKYRVKYDYNINNRKTICDLSKSGKYLATVTWSNIIYLFNNTTGDLIFRTALFSEKYNRPTPISIKILDNESHIFIFYKDDDSKFYGLLFDNKGNLLDVVNDIVGSYNELEIKTFDKNKISLQKFRNIRKDIFRIYEIR